MIIDTSPAQVYRRLVQSRAAGVLGRVMRSKEAAKRQMAARESKVALTREYRIGELPDIKAVQPASFFEPLGARPPSRAENSPR